MLTYFYPWSRSRLCLSLLASLTEYLDEHLYAACVIGAHRTCVNDAVLLCAGMRMDCRRSVCAGLLSNAGGVGYITGYGEGWAERGGAAGVAGAPRTGARACQAGAG